jgi:predicted double-glycine peptidase
MVGVDFGNATVTLNDPHYGVRVVSMASFEQTWSYLGRMALAVG